jgi:hypothetical protein
MSIGDKTSLANEDSYKAFLKSFETNA